jgi:hypothetical protein
LYEGAVSYGLGAPYVGGASYDGGVS